MDYADVTKSRESVQTAPSPSTRQRFSPDHARQVAADDAVRQKERAEQNRAALRRQSMADINRDVAEHAFRKFIEEDRVREKQNMQAGVEKMVRTVIRKESSEVRENEESESSQRARDSSSADYMREKVNSAYDSSTAESPRDKDLRPSPSERQQQRAIENYQQSTRNPVDQTVELVV